MLKPFAIYGHRGARGLAPENTLPGIRTALEIGVDGIEIDVYAVHGKLWVIHDPMVDRTTDGEGLLPELTADYLRGLDAGGGARIPFLEEVLEEINGRVPLNIELKHPEAAEEVAEAIERFRSGRSGWRPEKSVIISSFLPEALLRTRAAGPALPIGVLCLLPEHLETLWGVCEETGAVAIHPSYDWVDASFVETAHDKGLRVHAYTVNELDDARRLRTLGVDGIFTDFPDRMQSLRTVPA